MSENFLITIPHSGEQIPEQASWLRSLPEEILMCDVDRYVDRLYAPTLEQLKIASVKTEWHRYAVDLNRVPTDIDADSVVGSLHPSGTHSRGYHWVVTTYNHRLMPQPVSMAVHQELTQLIYEPFHAEVHQQYQKIKEAGFSEVYHLDAHSMPSLGTKMHRDPGQIRADVVVSDCSGTSCSKKFRDLVIAAYCAAGFKVAYNWPYLGGRVTEQYGNPDLGHHAIQVELSRALYMDEKTKQPLASFAQTQEKIMKAVAYIQQGLTQI